MCHPFRYGYLKSDRELMENPVTCVAVSLLLDIPSVHLHLSLVAGWLNVSTVGQEEQLCQLRAAEVVYMN